MTKLKKLKEQYEKLGEEIEKLEEDQDVFSELSKIVKIHNYHDDAIAIFGDKNMLISSYVDKVVAFLKIGEREIKAYVKEVEWEETTADKLKVGDVFVVEDKIDIYEDIPICNLNIKTGNDENYTSSIHLSSSEIPMEWNNVEDEIVYKAIPKRND